MTRNLSNDQISILKLLYRFRFGTTTLLNQVLKFNSRTSINARLDVLEKHKYIGKKYDKRYKLIGKPASYFLLKESFPALRQEQNVSAKILKNMYKNAELLPQSIDEYLDIFAIHNRLKQNYGDNLRFFTKGQLVDLKYFPKSLPDAYIRLQTKDSEKQFFLDVYRDSKPLFVHIRKIKQYVEYADSGSWEKTKTELPILLAVFESKTMQRQVRRRALKMLGDSFDFVLTLKEELLSDKISAWQPLSDPDDKLSLQDI